MAVFAIENGISSQMIGSNQQFILNPVEYSFDMDNLVSPVNLTFDFYCQTININQSSPLSFQEALQSLKTYLSKSSLILERNVTCFNNLSKI